MAYKSEKQSTIQSQYGNWPGQKTGVELVKNTSIWSILALTNLIEYRDSNFENFSRFYLNFALVKRKQSMTMGKYGKLAKREELRGRIGEKHTKFWSILAFQQIYLKIWL